MGKIKVVEFVTSLNMGGAEQLVKEYSLLLNKEKFDVTVLVIWRKENSKNERQLLEAGIKVVYVSDYLPTGNGLVTRILRKQERKKFIKKFISDEKPQIIHAHLAVLEYTVGLPLKQNNIKIVYTCHNVLSDTFDKTKYIQYAKKLIKESNMKMIALHKDMADEINQMFGIEDCMVLNNGIDFGDFSFDINVRKTTREMLNIPENTFVIGHVGRFTAQKNHRFLIDIYEKILEKNENVHLLLIGDGEDKKFIQDYIKEHNLDTNITILSNRDDVSELMNAMDVFVFPSIFEGFGIVLVEAQAIGLRCVVSDAISKYACLSPLVNVLSLDADKQCWIRHIMNEEWDETDFSGIEEFDIHNVVLALEKIYMDMLY